MAVSTNMPERLTLRALRLLKPLGLSLATWGSVALFVGANNVAANRETWAQAAASGLREWLPWALLTPCVFWLTERQPLDRQHLRTALPAQALCCLLALLACHWWKETLL